MAFVRTKEYAKLEARVAALEEKLTVNHPAPNIEHILSLHDVFGDDLANLLSVKYSSVEAVKAATDEDLRAISGVGPARLNEIRGLTE